MMIYIQLINTMSTIVSYTFNFAKLKEYDTMVLIVSYTFNFAKFLYPTCI